MPWQKRYSDPNALLIIFNTVLSSKNAESDNKAGSLFSFLHLKTSLIIEN